MPILYNIDVDFNITIPDFTSIVNISGTNNKAWNKANGKGANNNGWDSASNNSKDNNNKGDNNNKEDNNNRENISSIKI